MDKRASLSAYLRQQQELGMPDPVLGGAFDREKTIAAFGRTIARPVPAQVSAPERIPGVKQQAAHPFNRLARLAPLTSAVSAPPPRYGGGQQPDAPPRSLSFDEKRAALKELFTARCSACGLGRTRRSFVFGAGNVDAPLMIVGEAPGAEEDAQALPFVGAAGQLLTGLLSAVALDRKKDVFITNVLKCRPPENRTPESAEVAACLPLLEKQITIIAPRLLLLLGRVAAHALLGSAESVAKLRGKVHEWRGIPCIVSYHPAALLRSAEYRAPAEEDLRKAVRFLNEGTFDDDPR